jgi:hypothetical protein
MHRVAPPLEVRQSVGAATPRSVASASIVEPTRRAAQNDAGGENRPTERIAPARADSPHLKSTKELLKESGVASTKGPATGKPQRKRTDPAAGGVRVAAGTGDAVDKVLAGVQKEWGAGDLMVVWLLDASLSLVDDRQMIAAKLDPFYRELVAAKQGDPYTLLSAAVTYGQTTLELQGPTKFGVRLVQAARDEVVIDQTGLENVMTAVRDCVGKYRRSWKGNMLIVVWRPVSPGKRRRVRRRADGRLRQRAEFSQIRRSADRLSLLVADQAGARHGDARADAVAVLA